MPRSRRAVLFDLDDTLYPRRRFVLSGFAAVARHLDRQYQSGAPSVYRVLCDAYRHGGRGCELQIALRHFDLPPLLLPGLVALMRSHRPSLRLPASSRHALRHTPLDWRVGIVTNGLPSVQVNKVRALGLDAIVDDVVYACEHGTRAGKPDVAPFLVALARLGVPPHQAVFVGDDEACDIRGAAAAGLRTIRVARTEPAASLADATVRSLAEVPEILSQLDGRLEHQRDERLEIDTWSRDVA